MINSFRLLKDRKSKKGFNSQNKSPYQGAWSFSGVGLVFSLLS